MKRADDNSAAAIISQSIVPAGAWTIWRTRGEAIFNERKWAVASDGTQIPLSIFYRKDLVKLDGSSPLLLYGYGSYEEK
ncbi:hypothetical protein QJS10_CPB11g02357 [Acorus calamus]|uniref:Uncharacterized protein n=1 Tax=Acorus calamus TaxID=4465 RepID=A0AAV9DTU9_ACOCL|nr:hypothetical protein QJS10_CPB11g02357 [Acorus calamus]